MVVRQRGLVHHIWLDVELPRHTCRSCKREESESRTSRNSSIVSKGVCRLFSILSHWKPSHDLTLELDAHSPSDSEHWFQNHHFASDHEENGDPDTVQDDGTLCHDPKHGWVEGEQIRSPHENAVWRVLGNIDPSFRKGLPQVDVVSCFIIRHQFRRWLFPTTLFRILEKLCRVEHLIYEPWQTWSRWRRELFLNGMWQYHGLQNLLFLFEH